METAAPWRLGVNFAMTGNRLIHELYAEVRELAA
jgi:hypothetical protein